MYTHGMRWFLTASILLSFAAIAVFGFAAMSSHAMEGGHNDCVATVGQVALCPHESDFAMTRLHAQLFQRLTGAVALVLLLVSIVWLQFNWFSVTRLRTLFSTRLCMLRRRALEIVSILRHHSLFSWLALTERVSPAII